jgi:hypothetical protein
MRDRVGPGYCPDCAPNGKSSRRRSQNVIWHMGKTLVAQMKEHQDTNQDDSRGGNRDDDQNKHETGYLNGNILGSKERAHMNRSVTGNIVGAMDGSLTGNENENPDGELDWVREFEEFEKLRLLRLERDQAQP